MTDHTTPAGSRDDQPGTWRVGTHYGIHVYESERPVATFHRAEDAAEAVELHAERDQLKQDLADAERFMGLDRQQAIRATTERDQLRTELAAAVEQGQGWHAQWLATRQTAHDRQARIDDALTWIPEPGQPPWQWTPEKYEQHLQKIRRSLLAASPQAWTLASPQAASDQASGEARDQSGRWVGDRFEPFPGGTEGGGAP